MESPRQDRPHAIGGTGDVLRGIFSEADQRDRRFPAGSVSLSVLQYLLLVRNSHVGMEYAVTAVNIFQVCTIDDAQSEGNSRLVDAIARCHHADKKTHDPGRISHD